MTGERADAPNNKSACKAISRGSLRWAGVRRKADVSVAQGIFVALPAIAPSRRCLIVRFVLALAVVLTASCTSNAATDDSVLDGEVGQAATTSVEAEGNHLGLTEVPTSSSDEDSALAPSDSAPSHSVVPIGGPLSEWAEFDGEFYALANSGVARSRTGVEWFAIDLDIRPTEVPARIEVVDGSLIVGLDNTSGQPGGDLRVLSSEDGVRWVETREAMSAPTLRGGSAAPTRPPVNWIFESHISHDGAWAVLDAMPGQIWLNRGGRWIALELPQTFGMELLIATESFVVVRAQLAEQEILARFDIHVEPDA